MPTDDTRFLELLDRWLKGDYTRSDERELQALLAADEFRREAWEGFAALPAAQHELQLERLRKRLQPPGRRRIPMGLWLAAAAVLVLLLVAIYFLPDPKTEQAAPLARSSEPAREQALEPAAARPDSASGLVLLEPASPAVQPAPSGSKGITAPTDRRTAGAPPELAAVLSESPEAPRTPAAAAEKTGEKELAAKPEPGVPPAPWQVRSYPVQAMQDEPALHPESDTEQAVAQSRQAKEKQAAPLGGWADFHAFLRRNARLPEAARNNNISGKVWLEFNVNPDGKPANVLVIRSLGYGCDEEAMRLIQLFDWAPAGPDRVVVEVPFVH